MITFDEKSHSYKIDDFPCVSVTTVLKEMGIVSYAGIPEYIIERAATRGKYLHKMTELHLQGLLNEETLDPQLKPYLIGLKKFLSEHKVEILDIEKPIAYKGFLLAGTPDLRCMLDDIHSFVEWKFTYEVKKAGALQVNGGYRLIWNLNLNTLQEGKMPGPYIEQGKIVHITPNGYNLMPDDFYTPDDDKDFLCLLRAYRIKQRMK